MKNSLARLLLVVPVFASFSLSQAANLGAANDFNAVIFGNMTVNGGDSEGAIAVGGNWVTNNTYVVNSHSTTPNPSIGGATNLGLYVGGSMNAGSNPGSTQVNSARNAYIGGAVSGTPGMNGGILFSNSGLVSPTFFANQLAYSTAQSSTLAGLGGMSVNTSNPNNYSISIVNTGGLNVFQIDGSLLSGGKTLDVVGGTGAETIVFNVTGANVNWGTSYNGDKSKTLWNFSQASVLTVQDRALQGSVLATGAAVSMSQNIEGTLIANSLNSFNGAELHSFTFTGDPVPEPMTMLGLGAMALVAARRRKKAN